MQILKRLAAAVDRLNRAVGRAVMWLAVAMAVVQFANVVLRYVFSAGFISLQQSVTYMHAALFMLGAGFALMVDGHVRVDILYREARPKRKAIVDLFGALFLLLPLAIATLWLSLPYVLASWRDLEGSAEMSGLPIVYLLKTTIWAFAALLGLQGLALAIRAVVAIRQGDDSYSAAGSAARPLSGP